MKYYFSNEFQVIFEVSEKKAINIFTNDFFLVIYYELQVCRKIEKKKLKIQKTGS